MTEIERIQNNTNGELPNEMYEVLRVEDIDNPSEILEDFKHAIIAIVSNANLSPDSEEWYKILPQNIVDNVAKFEYDDFKKDELVFGIKSIIEDTQDSVIKAWEWYSSKLYTDGFEVTFKGEFHFRFAWFVRFQGVLASKISIEADGVNYPLTSQIRHDVVEYKKLYLK